MRRSAILVCLTALAACAPLAPTGAEGRVGQQASSRQCFFQSQVTNFRPGDTQTVYIKVLNRDVFELTSGGCSDLDFTNTLAITQQFGNSGRFCVGDSVQLVTSGPSLIHVPCRARVSRQLTEAELAALPSRQRP